MATQSELVGQLNDLTAQVTKTREETLAKLAELEAALEQAGNVVPDFVMDAVASLKATVQASDDVLPDA